MRFIDDVGLHLHAACAVLVVRTRDTIAVQREIINMCAASGVPARMYDPARGWVVDGDPAKANGNGQVDLAAGLRAILDINTATDVFPQNGVFILSNTHAFLDEKRIMPALTQMLTLAAHRLTATRRRIIITAPPGYALPTELRELAPIIEHEPPTVADLEELVMPNIEGYSENVRRTLPNLRRVEQQRLAQAGVGMTAFEFENALALTCISASRSATRATAETLRRDLLQYKAAMVNRHPALSVMAPVRLEQVGGLQNLKDWMKTRVNAMDPAAWEAGVDKPKGVALVGPPGCLSGDTVMLYRRGKRNSGREITLADLYRKFNALPASTRGWDTDVPTYLHSHDAETGEVYYNRAVSVIDAGVKPVLLLTTEGGRQLKLTADHPVLTEEGYVRADALRGGDQIIVRGDMKPRASPVPRLGRKPRVTVEGLRYYASGWRKDVGCHDTGAVYTYRRQHRARLVVEAQMNGMSYRAYVQALKTDPGAANLRTLPEGLVVHHIDENPMNDAPGNLQVLLKVDHDRLHTDEGNFNVEYTTHDRVLSVEFAGDEQTYDIQMAAPCNNFATADGLLVHNTGKSLCAQVIGSVLGVATISFTVSAVFDGLVGSSERNMREALGMIKSLAPCVVLMDELDKVFTTGPSGDSGTSQKVLGALLTFMQENDRAIMWVPTVNRVEYMPAELFRAGRLDAVFGLTLPNAVEREEILRIHMEKRKIDVPSLGDLYDVIERMDGFVGAEIENVAKVARLNAYNDDRAVTVDDLLSAAEATKPLSETMAEQFNNMKAWCETRALPASPPATPRPRPDGGPARRRIRRMN